MSDVQLEETLTNRLAVLMGTGSAPAEIRGLSRMHGGASGLTYCATAAMGDDSRDIVIKVAPPGLMPRKNRDVLRQARIMRVMAEHSVVPVPTVLAEDEGAPPEVSPLFVTNWVAGDAFEPILDPVDVIPEPAEIRARELDCATMLGRLHSFSPESLGLGDEPVVTLDAELARWSKVIETIDEDLRPNWSEVASRLLASVPGPVAAVLQHGDFRLGNTLADAGRIRAVIDWEIWTVGDPRVDLGWYLMSTHSSKQASAIRDVEGMPSDAELVARYESVSGVEVVDLTWFEAFTQFKAAAITGQIIKHNRRAETPHAVVSTWDPHLPQTFLATAERLLGDLGA